MLRVNVCSVLHYGFPFFPPVLASNTELVRQPVTELDLTVFWFHNCSQNQIGIT